MTVAELIAELQKLPQDFEVILQKDSEGNGYSPLEGAYDECTYVPESTWSGVVYNNEEFQSENEEGYVDNPDDAIPVVVLVPVN